MDEYNHKFRHSVTIFQKTWVWEKSTNLNYPVFPIFSAGTVTSQKDRGKIMYYALDMKYNLWLGFERDNIVYLEHFSVPLGMDIVYNFNILGWAQVCDGIPIDIYSPIVKQV
jgi:hypothetical protein